MVSSNIFTLGEVSDNNTSTPATAQIQPQQPRDDQNNPIVIIMNESPTVTAADIIANSIPPAPTTTAAEVPSYVDASTLDEDAPTNDNVNTGLVATRPSSALSSGDDSDCASDTTCENDDKLTASDMPLNIDNGSYPDAELPPKALLMSSDILISHSTPVIVPQMATVPSRPHKSNRPTPKAGVNSPAGKIAVAQKPNEEAKPTVRLLMLCQKSSHQFETRNIVLEPNQEVKVGRSITRNRVTDNNAIFDCKVLSRNHALIWMADGKFYIRDTASSNGTFVNEHRLSLTATPSKPYEVKTGDIVQFGVDVLENSFSEKHGCIITMLKFCAGNAEAEEIKRANANNCDDRFTKLGNSQSAGRSLSSAELYQLNTFIQEAMQREQTLETKLLSLQKIIDQTRKNSANVWQPMIDEDHLLSRIDILENKLQYYQKNFTDDKLRKDIMKLQDDKAVYQAVAKEAIRKVYHDRNEAILKLATFERALCSSEDECALLRNQLLKSQQNFKEVTVSLTLLEERDAKLQSQEQVYVQREAMSDQKMLELYDQIKLRTVECLDAKTSYEAVAKDNADLLERIEMYEKLSERVNEATEDEDEASNAESSTVIRWLDQMRNKSDDTTNVAMSNTNKKAITDIHNLNISAKLGDIEKNLSVLESIQMQLQDKITNNSAATSNPDTPEAPVIIEANATTNDASIELVAKVLPAVSCDKQQVLLETILQLKDVYVELRTSLVRTENESNKRETELETNLVHCQEELKQLRSDLRARPTADAVAVKTKECDELRQEICELTADSKFLQLQLCKSSLESSAKRVHSHVQTDEPSSSVQATQPSKTSITTYVQTEPSLVDPVVLQPPLANGVHSSQVVASVDQPLNAVETVSADTPATIISPSNEFADDIALLTNPNVLLESELITMKEQCTQLIADNRKLSVRLGELSSRGDSVQNKASTMWLVGALVAVIAYMLVSSYF